jgi:PKD repeat protein
MAGPDGLPSHQAAWVVCLNLFTLRLCVFRMRTLSLALVAAFVLAGCAGSTTDDAPVTTSEQTRERTTTTSAPATQTSTTSTATTTSDGAGSGNKAPTATLTASTVTGTAPVLVEFTLDGADPDGDKLTWTLSFGDNSGDSTGDELPATREHNFTAAGTYNVTLTVSDGKLSTTKTVAVQVDAAGGSGQQQVIKGSFTTSGPYECVLGFQSATSGLTFLRGDVDPSTIGKPFTAKFTSATPAIEYDIDFFGPDGYINTIYGGATITDVVPDGADRVFFYTCGGGVNVSVEYVAG